jgi:hypothetical protein
MKLNNKTVKLIEKDRESGDTFREIAEKRNVAISTAHKYAMQTLPVRAPKTPNAVQKKVEPIEADKSKIDIKAISKKIGISEFILDLLLGDLNKMEPKEVVEKNLKHIPTFGTSEDENRNMLMEAIELLQVQQ